uniref:Uncharacterized protein n=1 Tax=Kwoniella bestiolae CBS 10118 TaxID=1296100 RepID=A0A1B9GAG0_9TREE|nr:hypothetical protein I302_02857 [Kwoniella bestiolae CBS 10118]OCF28006.1 hypothetical protein I302_02857 [Kwoniella bestiolae CBS 10118]
MSSETSSTGRSGTSSWGDPSPSKYDRAANDSSSSIVSGGDDHQSLNASPAGTPLQTPLDTRERENPLATSPDTRNDQCNPGKPASPTPGLERANPFNSAHQALGVRQSDVSGVNGEYPKSWRERSNAQTVEATPTKGEMERKDSGLDQPPE